MNAPEQITAEAEAARRRGDKLFIADGRCWYVSPPTEIEMLHRVCDLLTEIRDLLKDKTT